MKTIKQWLNSKEIKKLQKESITKLITKDFFRDPFRPLYYNPKVFLSPADGIVLYTYDRIGPTDKIVEIKGVNFTIQDLLHDKNYNEESLIIGIFMTLFDVHINRVPIDSYMSESIDTEFIYTHNSSMYFFEQNLLNDLKINPDNMGYLFKNEKVISTFYCSKIRDEYYIVQIADKDVNAIVNWVDEGDFIQQAERFGMVRWGSQVDIVIPVNEIINYEILVKPYYHIEGGIDKIIRIKNE